MGKKISNRISRMLREPKKWDRKFLGKLSNFDSKEEEKMEKKHLKAYIRGDERFAWGTREVMNPLTGLLEVVPNFLPVKQELIRIQ